MNDYYLYIIFFTFALIIGIMYLTKRYTIKQIVGFSMYPSFKNGEWIIIRKHFNLEVGNVYVFTNPEDLPCIKRLEKIVVAPTNGGMSLFFTGDNSEDSIDSRHFGLINPSKVLGEVVKGRK